MIDRFGRSLSYLRISVVDRCNLQCLYCMPSGGAGFDPWGELLSYDEIVLLAGIFAELGVEKIRLTGGEPLIRKDLPDLISRLRRISGIREIALSTNGVFLKEQIKSLRAAGLDRVNISLDTLRPERFLAIAKMDRFRDVMEGIDAALDSGLAPVKINAVLMKGINHDEVLDLTRFAVAKAIEVRFIELMTTNDNVAMNPKENFFSTQEARALIEKEYELEPVDAYFSSPAQVFKIRGTAARVGLISPISCFFCARCNRVRLKANGMLKTCLHGKEDLDLKALLRSGAKREEIKNKIEQAVYDRPEQHFLNETQVKHQNFQMSHVGG